MTEYKEKKLIEAFNEDERHGNGKGPAIVFVVVFLVILFCVIYKLFIK